MPLKPQLKATVEVGAGAAIRADRSLERQTEQLQNRVNQTKLDVDETLLKCNETGINNLAVVSSRLADMKVSIDASLMALGPQVTASLMSAVDECQSLVKSAHESNQELQQTHRTDRACHDELTNALKLQIRSLQSIIGQQVKSIHEVVAQADQLDHLLCWCKSVVLRVMAERLRWQQTTGGVALHEARAGDSAASFVERCRAALNKLEGSDFSYHRNNEDPNSPSINNNKNHHLVRGVVDTADAVADRFFARVEAKRPEAFVSTKEEIGLLRELLNATLSETERDFVPVEAPKEIITRPQLAQIHREVTSLGQMTKALRASFIDEMRQTAATLQDANLKSSDKMKEFAASQRRQIQRMEDEIRSEFALKSITLKKDIGVQTMVHQHYQHRPSGTGNNMLSDSMISQYGNNTYSSTSARKGTPDLLSSTREYLSLKNTTNNNHNNHNNNNNNDRLDASGGLIDNDDDDIAEEERIQQEMIKAAASRRGKKNNNQDENNNPSSEIENNNNNVGETNNNMENSSHMHHHPKPPGQQQQQQDHMSKSSASIRSKNVSFVSTSQNNNNNNNVGNGSNSHHRPSVSNSSHHQTKSLSPSTSSLSASTHHQKRQSVSNTNSGVAFGASTSRKTSVVGGSSPGRRRSSVHHHHAVSPTRSPWKWVPDTKKVVKILLSAQEQQQNKTQNKTKKRDSDAFIKRLEEERKKIRDEVEKEYRKKLRQQRREKGETVETSDDEEEKKKKQEQQQQEEEKSKSKAEAEAEDEVDESTLTPEEKEEREKKRQEKEEERKRKEEEAKDPNVALNNKVDNILKKLLESSVSDGSMIQQMLESRREKYEEEKARRDKADEQEGQGGDDTNNKDDNDNDDGENTNENRIVNDDEGAREGDDENNNDDPDAASTNTVLDIVKELQQELSNRSTTSGAGGNTNKNTKTNSGDKNSVVKDWGKWKYEGKGVASSNPPPKPPPIDISWIKNFVDIAHRKGVIVSPESLLQEFVNEDGVPIVPSASSSMKKSGNNGIDESNSSSHQPSRQDSSLQNSNVLDSRADASVTSVSALMGASATSHDDRDQQDHHQENAEDVFDNQEQSTKVYLDDQSSHHLLPGGASGTSSSSKQVTTGRYNQSHQQLHHPHRPTGDTNQQQQQLHSLSSNRSSSTHNSQRLDLSGKALLPEEQQRRLEDDIMRDVSEHPPMIEPPAPFDSIPSAIISMAQPHSASHADRVSGVSWTHTRFSAGGGMELEMPTIDVGKTLENRIQSKNSNLVVLEKRTEKQNKLTDATATRLQDAMKYVNNLEKKTDVLVTRYVMGADKIREQKKQKQLDKLHRRQQQLLQQGKLAHNLKLEDISDDDDDENNDNNETTGRGDPPHRVPSSRTARPSRSRSPPTTGGDPIYRVGHEEAPRSGRLPKASRLLSKTQ